MPAIHPDPVVMSAPQVAGPIRYRPKNGAAAHRRERPAGWAVPSRGVNGKFDIFAFIGDYLELPIR
jgi:hypothetical protein